jgi:phosphomannomutase/phosphoglucomutase
MNVYQLTQEIPESVFRAYDIRGNANLLTDDVTYSIAHAFAAQLKQRQITCCLVGRDGRISSPRIFAALTAGLLASGIDIVDLGVIPTPLLYFAAATGEVTSGIMITASHNPPQDNGLKMIFETRSPSAEIIKDVYHIARQGHFASAQQPGHITQRAVIPEYIDYIKNTVQLEKTLRVVIDCSNGVSGLVAPELFNALGCDLMALNTTVDGQFPSHKPDTSLPEAYEQLQAAVLAEKADVGIMFDGDADRVGVVCNNGQILWPDRLLMLMAIALLEQYPGSTIVYDVKSTQHLKSVIEQHGGVPLMWRTGHSFMKEKVHETHAPVGGELSGHVFFNDRWFGFDDGIYTAVRLLEVISQKAESVKTLFAQFPETVATPEILYPVADNKKFLVIERLQQTTFPGSLDVNKIDGVRVSFPHGWALVRASNTSPNLTLRFEADTQTALDEIQQQMLQCMADVIEGPLSS